MKMASRGRGRPKGSVPDYFFRLPEQLIEDFPLESLKFESWVEDLIQGQPKFKRRPPKKSLIE